MVAPTTTVERRASVRYACRAHARVSVAQTIGHALGVQARVRDISTGGISLIMSQWFGPGTILEIEFARGEARSQRAFTASVMHATLLPDGEWFLGCALVDHLDPSHLREFI